jgi:5-formaminoimidazole-4-carboxamide-1-beta-D-ribofuranosyl 5'-monophosphate synthetase
MALALNNYKTVVAIASTSPVGIYTAPSGYNSVVLCAQATNTSNSSQDVTLAHQRNISGIAVTTYSSYKKPVASHDITELTTGKLVLIPGDSFVLSSSVNNQVHVIVSVLETLI